MEINCEVWHTVRTMSMTAVGAYLQKQRLAAGYTQQKIADELGVTNRAVSDWEAGRYSPSFDLMARFVRMVNGHIEEVMRLFFDDDVVDHRAELAALATTLSDEELEAALTAIRQVRADPNRHDAIDAGASARPKKSTRRRQGSRQKPSN